MPQTMLVHHAPVAANEPQVVDAYRKAISRTIAYMLNPPTRKTVNTAMAAQFALSNAVEADEAYKAVISVYERLPYPTADRMNGSMACSPLTIRSSSTRRGRNDDRRLLCPQARHLGVRPERSQEALTHSFSYC